MRLLLRDAISRQKVNDRLGLDLEFAGQLVDSDLICFAHASYGQFSNQNLLLAELRLGKSCRGLSFIKAWAHHPLPSLRLRNLRPRNVSPLRALQRPQALP